MGINVAASGAVSVLVLPPLSLPTYDLDGVNGRGAMPMGLATIVTMLVYVAVPLSPGFLYFTQVLFWIDAVFSFMTCFGVPLYMSLTRPLSPYTLLFH